MAKIICRSNISYVTITEPPGMLVVITVIYIHCFTQSDLLYLVGRGDSMVIAQFTWWVECHSLVIAWWGPLRMS